MVLAADRAALAAGLRVGMPATKAQALVKGLIVNDAEPAADTQALKRLALWALRYAPIVAADPPEGLVIDTTGAAHLHGGEDTMVKAMVERLAASGTPRGQQSPIAGEPHMALPAAPRGRYASFRLKKARKRFLICRSRFFVCPRI